MYPTNEENKPQEEERWQPTVPLYEEWLGSPVVINYTRGPSWTELDNPYDLATGELEGREALFYLEQAGPVGVGVRRILEGEDSRERLGILLFVPWGAINVMYSALPVDKEEQVDEET